MATHMTRPSPQILHISSTDPSCPVPTMVTSSSLYELCGQHVTVVHYFLYPKVNSIMSYPAVPRKLITLFAGVSNVDISIVGVARKPHKTQH